MGDTSTLPYVHGKMMDQLSCFQTSPSVNELDKTVAGTSKLIPADDGSDFCIFGDQRDFVYIYIYNLVDGIPTPLKNMSSSVGIIIPNVWKNKNCSKPPTTLCSITIYVYLLW